MENLMNLGVTPRFSIKDGRVYSAGVLFCLRGQKRQCMKMFSIFHLNLNVVFHVVLGVKN